MVHGPRIDYSGAIHHVTSRGTSRAEICHTNADYAALVGSVAEATRIANWRCFGYCVMPNDYHLVIQTPVPTLSLGMHRLNGMYAARYNATYEHSGHVFEGRFHAELVRSDEHLLEALRYVALNPVRAMLARSPETWRWSSYGATAGLRASPEWLAADRVIGLFGTDRADSQRRYREVVGAGRTAPASRPALARLVTAARRSDIVAAQEHGYTQSEIAALLGVSQPTVSRILSRSAD